MTTVSTRRAFLKSAPAAIVSSAVLPASASAASASAVSAEPVAASPALVEAYGRLRAAFVEEREAKEALEWIADEWRHRWPLAPEELLWGANADRCGSWRDTAERDIIGNIIHRDTSALGKRFSAKFRSETPKTCFSVQTSESLQDTVDAWTEREPTGRTEKALARNRVRRTEVIQEYSQKVALARQYEAETERLRQAAGVSEAQDRVLEAKRQVASACRDISNLPATNVKDVLIKGEAILTDDLVKACKSHPGILGDMVRFVQDTIDLSVGASL
jgi:hypothetical protein